MKQDGTHEHVNLYEESVVQASLGMRWVDLTDQVVVLDVLTDRVFRLNSTGGFIWRRLQRPRRVRDLQAEVASAYGIDEEESREASQEFLRGLLAHRLIGSTTQDPDTQGSAQITTGEEAI